MPVKAGHRIREHGDEHHTKWQWPAKGDLYGQCPTDYFGDIGHYDPDLGLDPQRGADAGVVARATDGRQALARGHAQAGGEILH